MADGRNTADGAGWPERIDPGDLSRFADRVQTAGEREDLAVVSPVTGDQIGAVPACTSSAVQAAVERARAAQAGWAERPLAERREVLLSLHDLVLDERERILDLVCLETGKSRRDAFEEVLDVAMTCRHYAERAADYLGSRRRQGAVPLLTRTEEHRQPVGVVGLISPWNYPLTLTISDAIPALLAGNSVVCKPATETPFTALAAQDLLRRAGLPAGRFEVVTGSGGEVGPPLVESVDFLGFTGSTATGRKVASQAAENLVATSLELGGKNPLVVLPDADLDRAVEGVVRACFANAGQLCISAERVYVPDAIADPFLDRLVARTRRLDVGVGYGYDLEMGSLLSPDQLEKVQAHVDDARESGASVLTGGRHRPDLGPWVYEPTVLADVTPEMDAYGEETFGPVASIYRYDDVGEAIEAANDSPYGLHASVWTEDEERGRRVARQIDCGTVSVNDAYAAAWGSIDAPMGGMGDSGLGRRHGREGILKYTESQTIAVQRGPAIGPPPGVPAKWYAKAMTLGMDLLSRLPGVR